MVQTVQYSFSVTVDSIIYPIGANYKGMLNLQFEGDETAGRGFLSRKTGAPLEHVTDL